MNVYRQGSSTPVSAGSMILGKVEEGVPCEFLFYNDEGYSDRRDSHLQWVPLRLLAEEILHGAPNYGLDRPGTTPTPRPTTRQGSPDGGRAAGTRRPSSPRTSSSTRERPSYSNRWIANF